MAAWCFVCHGMGDGSPYAFWFLSFALMSCRIPALLLTMEQFDCLARHGKIRAGTSKRLDGGLPLQAASQAQGEGPAASGQPLPGVAQRLLHQTFSRAFLQPFWALRNAWHGCLRRHFSLQGAWPLCAALFANDPPFPLCCQKGGSKAIILCQVPRVKPMVGYGAKAQSLMAKPMAQVI